MQAPLGAGASLSATLIVAWAVGCGKEAGAAACGPAAGRYNAGHSDRDEGEGMRANTDWFMRARWGVFTHYLTGPEISRR